MLGLKKDHTKPYLVSKRSVIYGSMYKHLHFFKNHVEIIGIRQINYLKVSRRAEMLLITIIDIEGR